MTDVAPPSPWYRALSFSERRARIGSAGGCAPTGGPAPREDEVAAWRLQRWRRQPPFDRPTTFAERLALDGLDEGLFAALLATDDAPVAGETGELPGWAARIEESLAACQAPPPPADSLRPEGTVTARMVRVFHPLIEPARKRLAAAARSLLPRAEGLFHVEGVVDAFWPAAENRIMTLAGRTLVLELHVAREEGRLRGDTPKSRFDSFLEGMEAPGAIRIFLEEYAVLARQLQLTLDRWVEAAAEFLERLVADAPLLASRFSPDGHLGALTALDPGAGDLHRGGRSVVLVRFSSGLALVYKPRPLALDLRFQELVDWLNRTSSVPPLRTLEMLDRGAYGWSELVAPAPCAARPEVERFHQRLGALLALFHLLEATDLHFENLIAAGEQPVAVDLETLLHPRPPVAPHPQQDLRLLAEHVVASVLRTGLLPFQLGGGAGQAGLDASGLASVEGELSPGRVLTWEAAGTDEMHAVRKRLPLPGGDNRPKLDGHEVEALDYLHELVEGFATAYRCLAEHRQELAAPEGLLGRFASSPSRAVLRATRTYHLIWFEAFHPDFLRSGLDRDFLLDRLWVGAADLPHLRRVLAWERRDLDEGDIPAFGARPDTADLWTAGGERLAGYFPEPALAVVRRKLAALSEEDLARQEELIRAVLATRGLRNGTAAWPTYEMRKPEDAPTLSSLRPRLLAQAEAVAARLERQALRSPGQATWLAVEFQASRWSLVTLPEDLYAGLPGVALFLARLGELTGAPAWERLARDAVATLLDRLDRQAEALLAIGAFQGWGGVVYALRQLSALWRDDALERRADQYLERIAPLVERDQDLDVIGGAAGCIGALLGSPSGPASGRTLKLARACGERLLGAAEPAGDGLGWRNRVAADRPQLGFSHGAAGYAWALFRLAQATGEPRFRAAALAGFRYEHALYDPLHRNWLDAGDPETSGRPRQGGERSNCMAWCYGAPGVALSRLPAADASGEPFVHRDLERALAATLSLGFGYNHSLCHGDLGNLDILLLAARRFSDAGLEQEVARRAAGVLDSLERHGPLCGTPCGIESPGLMNGYAGIGYGLLRLAFPERVPSVLALESVPS